MLSRGVSILTSAEAGKVHVRVQLLGCVVRCGGAEAVGEICTW
jgi:hypothetical protein